MIFIDHETELTPELLKKLISQFKLETEPKLKKWDNYYKGKHLILSKSYKDPSKPCNRIVTNFCKVVTDTYSGYMVGKPVSYTSNDDIEAVQDVINYNDSDSEDMRWCRNALIYGVAHELYWLDKDAQVRYGQINPLNSFAIYSNTLDRELLYFVRWYKADSTNDSNKHYFEVYSATNVTVYESFGDNGDLTFLEQREHHFKDVPVSVFSLNDNEESIFNSIITLNDAYNELQSAEIDDFNAWVDAYLVLSGMDAELDDIQSMKESRVLIIPEGATASWLTKNTNDTQIVNMLENIKKNIFKVANCPDMGDESFMSQSGIAIQYKLVGLENAASGIIANFTKAIQRRIEIICTILNLKATEAVWRDIRISFTRNLPENTTETVALINSLKGTVSDATLLSQLPFIDDVQSELEALKKQREEQASIYGFGFDIPDDEEEEV